MFQDWLLLRLVLTALTTKISAKYWFSALFKYTTIGYCNYLSFVLKSIGNHSITITDFIMLNINSIEREHEPGIHLYNHQSPLKLILKRLKHWETKLTKPKNNLLPAKRKALVALKLNHEIDLKKADKSTTTLVMNIQNKINEGQIQLNDIEHYRPPEKNDDKRHKPRSQGPLLLGPQQR